MATFGFPGPPPRRISTESLVSTWHTHALTTGMRYSNSEFCCADAARSLDTV